jgi:hypothetical protein
MASRNVRRENPRAKRDPSPGLKHGRRAQDDDAGLVVKDAEFAENCRATDELRLRLRTRVRRGLVAAIFA